MSDDLALIPQDQMTHFRAIVGIQIVDHATEKSAVDGLSLIQGCRRGLEKAQKEKTEPLEKRKKEIIAFYKEPIAALTDFESRVKRALLDWTLLKQRQAAEEAERIRKANEEAARAAEAEEAARKAAVEAETKAAALAVGMTTEDAGTLARLEAEDVVVAAPAPMAVPVAPPPQMKGAVGGATIREVWTWDRENVNTAIVPREYLTIDYGAITRAVNAGIREIPGVRIFAQKSVVGTK